MYDSIEIGRRIAVCFSVGELRELAASLGVADSVRWDRGIHHASRDVVEHCGKYAGLDALVSRLREVRPLVEWPDPQQVTTGPQVIPNPMPPSASPFIGGGVPTLDGGAGPTMSPAPGPPIPFGARGLNPAEPGVGRSNGPLLLVVAAAGVACGLLIAGAFFVGRASSPGKSQDSAPSEAPAPSASSQPGGERLPQPARIAAALVAKGLENVARACEIGAGDGLDTMVFARAFDRCGRSPVRYPAVPSLPTPSRVEGPQPDDLPPPKLAPRGGREVPLADRPRREGMCLDACEAAHRGCDRRCGAEPTEAAAYEAYNRCLSRCLSTASRCRLDCR